MGGERREKKIWKRVRMRGGREMGEEVMRRWAEEKGVQKRKMLMRSKLREKRNVI